MFIKLLKKIYQQLVLLVVVALVLVAAYVSLGRQFMPQIAGYNSFFEEQIFANTGLAVSIDSLSGEFQGFNPVINISGLSLLVGDGVENSAPLNFDRAMIIIDVPRSIWQRRLVLEEFLVERLALSVVQDDSGAWSLGSMSASGGGTADPADLYQSLLRVNRLDFREVIIDVENRFGENYRFSQGVAAIQNRGTEHFLHVDMTHEDSGQQLLLSFEATGDELEAVTGEFHVSVPRADYSGLMRSIDFPQTGIEEFIGGGDFWLQWREGSLLQSVASLDVDALTLSTQEGGRLGLEAIRGNARLRRQSLVSDANSTTQLISQSAWSLSLSQMTMTLEDHYWRPFSMHVNYVPERSVDVRADNINLALLAEAALQSAVLDDAARSQLLGYSPAGTLANLAVSIPFPESGNPNLTVRGNLDNVELGSVRGSPNMWGLDGYFEVRFDRNANLVSGNAAVESDNFSINIPNVFTQVWDYDYVNGALDFEVDLRGGQRVSLTSGMIVAESDAVDGHVQFRSVTDQPAQGERSAQLDLLIGASRIDADARALYLPNGPGVAANVRNSMDYLNRAIVDGDLFDSSVVFRGNTLPGTGPETKTFQGFFQVENGIFEFNEQWPPIEGLAATVLTSDNDTDIDATAGTSLGLSLQGASGQIRRNEANENWLTVRGNASGETAAGLDYVQAAPLNDNLQAAFVDWRAGGDFDADIEVLIPLSLPGEQPDIRLAMEVVNNEITIENLQLEMAELTGPIVFDTRTGLEPTQLSAHFFGDEVLVDLSSEFLEDELATLFVDVSGNTTPEQLIQWPRQSEFARDLLRQAEGEFSYQARLAVDQIGQQEAPTQLTVRTDFVGTELALPIPFAKPAEVARPFELEIAFNDERQRINGSLAEQMVFQLDLVADELQDGLVVIGESTGQFDSLVENETEGLAIIGGMEVFELEQWTAFLAEMGATDGSDSSINSNIAFVDLLSDNFNLYGQSIPDVAFRVEPNEELQGWWSRLESESLRGEVVIPFRLEDHLLIDLDYLRLPGDPEEEARLALLAQGAITEEELAEETEEAVEEEAIDPLLDIDPRELPRMRFSTDEFAIGSRQYGSWRFTLNPNESGAEFNDLVFDFRGLRLGMDEVDDSIEELPAHFTWYYDGEQHRSDLSGVLIAADIGEVLLANGFAASLVSDRAVFVSEVSWPGSPAFFSGDHLSGRLDMLVEDGRFLQDSNAGGALKLVSIINFSAIMRRLRFSDDLLRRGLAFDEITGRMLLDDGEVEIQERLVISGPSSVYQVTGGIDLEQETISGEMFVTLPVSDNIPWLGLLTANIPLAVGAYLFDQIFGDQVDSLTSAVYTLEGPWEGLQPEFKQAFGSPESANEAAQEAGAAASVPAPQ